MTSLSVEALRELKNSCSNPKNETASVHCSPAQYPIMFREYAEHITFFARGLKS